MLTVCQACRDDGALPLKRTRKRNGSAKARHIETVRLRAEVRDDQEAPVERAEGITAPSSEAEANPRAPATQRQVRKRNRRPPDPSAPSGPTAPTYGVLPSTPASNDGVLQSTPAPTSGILSSTVDPTLCVPATTPGAR